MVSFKGTLLAAAAVLAMTAGAQASTISGGTASNTPGEFTDYNHTLVNPTNLTGALSKFDTTLGTLTKVTFTVSYGFNSTLTITAGTNGAAGYAQTESGAAFRSNDSGITAVLNALVNTTSVVFGAGPNQQLVPAAYDVTGNKGFYNLGALGTTTVTSTGSGAGSYNTSNATYLNAFSAAGGGAFNAIGQTLTGTIVSNSDGNSTASQVTTATQSISISYDYTDAPPPAGVPEPATMALLGAGLVGLGLIRRKRD